MEYAVQYSDFRYNKESIGCLGCCFSANRRVCSKAKTLQNVFQKAEKWWRYYF